MTIADPDSIDIVTDHPADGYVALIMIEDGGWLEPAKALQQVQAKLNTYLGYALDGQLGADYPDLANKRIRVQLATTTRPPRQIAGVLAHIANACEEHDVEFVVNEL